jgi:hypothetical protein
VQHVYHHERRARARIAVLTVDSAALPGRDVRNTLAFLDITKSGLEPLIGIDLSLLFRVLTATMEKLSQRCACRRTVNAATLTALSSFRFLRAWDVLAAWPYGGPGVLESAQSAASTYLTPPSRRTWNPL